MGKNLQRNCGYAKLKMKKNTSKSMLPKQRSYIIDFSLILQAMEFCKKKEWTAEIDKATIFKS